MLNKFIVLTSFMAFAMLAVAATTMVTQETYAENNTTTQETCEPGWHLVPSNHTGVKICASDKEGSPEYTTPKHPTLNP